MTTECPFVAGRFPPPTLWYCRAGKTLRQPTEWPGVLPDWITTTQQKRNVSLNLVNQRILAMQQSWLVPAVYQSPRICRARKVAKPRSTAFSPLPHRSNANPLAPSAVPSEKPTCATLPSWPRRTTGAALGFGRIPETGRAILATRGQPPAVRTKRCAQNFPCMSG